MWNIFWQKTDKRISYQELEKMNTGRLSDLIERETAKSREPSMTSPHYRCTITPPKPYVSLHGPDYLLTDRQFMDAGLAV